MAEIFDFDPVNNRQHSMWVEAGIQFRSNLLLSMDAKVELHAHSFDHVSLVTFGWVLLTEIHPDGREFTYQMASKGYVPQRIDIAFEPVSYRLENKAWVKHQFTPIEFTGQPIEVLCLMVHEE